MSAAASSPPRPWRADDLFALEVPSDPQLSPDGQWVAHVRSRADEGSDTYGTSIWLLSHDGVNERRLTSGPGDTSPQWSPDGRTIAFLRPDGNGRAQLWLVSPWGGEPVQLTRRAAGAGRPRWSPDGSRIAFAAVVPGDPDRLAPVAVDDLDYKGDGAGLLRGASSQLFVVAVEDGRTHQLTWGSWWVDGPVWSPDGQQLAFAADRGPERDVLPASAVHVVDLRGTRCQRLTAEESVLAPAAWDDNGLLVSGRRENGVHLDRLWLLDPVEPDGTLLPLAPELDVQIATGGPGYPGGEPRLHQDAAYFCVSHRGAVHVLCAPLDGGPAETVVGGDVVVAGFSLAGSRTAYVAATARDAGELYVDGSAITDTFGTALPGVSVHVGRGRTWAAPDGTELHGWVLRDEAVIGPTPLLVDIHGGPHNSFAPAFDPIRLYHQELANRGWTVVYVNLRGSDGYGEDFLRAVSTDWGRSDEGDVYAVVEALVSEGTADPERLAVAGYSYGGFLTCWLTARSGRFRAAVAGGLICDLSSMFGTCDNGSYLGRFEFGGTPYDDGEHLRRHSPITYAGSVTTPTLVMHGEEDQRCPVSQAEQWFAALRHHDVPSRMVRYPGGSHLFLLGPRPSQRIDYADRLTSWVVERVDGPEREVRPPLAARLHGYDERLTSLLAQYDVPGAALGVLHEREVHVVVAGTANVDTGAAVRPSTLFQIGSNAKLYTASLVLRLADRGLLDIEDLVVTHLPDLALGDPAVLRELRIRHLLTHTSGLTGDHFGPFTDWADDAIEQYVGTLADVDQLHPVGAHLSYCNSGWSVLGRLVEVLTGMPYADALREHLTDPLGVATPLVRPNDVVMHEAAVGHVVDEDGVRTASTYQLLPSHVAAGSVPAASAADVLAFLRMHLEDGVAADGTRVLSAEAVRNMQKKRADVALPIDGVEGYGLGWRVGHLGDERLIGHGGGTIGGISTLEVLPDRELAVVVLTNAGGGAELGDVVFRDVVAELLGLDVPPTSVAVPIGRPEVDDPAAYVGTYVHGTGRAVVTADEAGVLTLHVVEPSLSPDMDAPPTTAVLLPTADPERFGNDGEIVRFVELGPDGYQYLYLGRLFARRPHHEGAR